MCEGKKFKLEEEKKGDRRARAIQLALMKWMMKSQKMRELCTNENPSFHDTCVCVCVCGKVTHTFDQLTLFLPIDSHVIAKDWKSGLDVILHIFLEFEDDHMG